MPMSKKSISIYELIELVRASVYSGTIKKDYPDYLDACRELGMSSYVLNLIIQREKDKQKSGQVEDDYTDLLFIKEQKVEDTPPPFVVPPTVPPPIPALDSPKESNGSTVVWILVALFLMVSIILLAFMLDYRQKTTSLNDELDYTQAQLSNYKDVFRNISDMTTDLQDDKWLGSWKSTNHDNNSVSEKKYDFTASPGDRLTFNYSVSSESFDSLIVKLTCEGKAKMFFKVSGLVSSSRSYVIDKKGNYCLHLKYKKDGSLNSNDDNAAVNNICVHTDIKSIVDSIHVICSEYSDF